MHTPTHTPETYLDYLLEDALGIEAVITAHSPVITGIPAHVGQKPAPVTYTEIVRHQWDAAVALTMSGAAR